MRPFVSPGQVRQPVAQGIGKTRPQGRRRLFQRRTSVQRKAGGFARDGYEDDREPATHLSQNLRGAVTASQTPYPGRVAVHSQRAEICRVINHLRQRGEKFRDGVNLHPQDR